MTSEYLRNFEVMDEVTDDDSPQSEQVFAKRCLRKAFLKKAEFYDTITQRGGGDQPDFISLIQK